VDLRHRIGPNAIIQVMASMRALCGVLPTQQLFVGLGLGHYLESQPVAMVDEAEVTALQQALRRNLGEDTARQISWDAGCRTGDYLLAYRIPKAAQRLLRLLPCAFSARILVRAISRHAWTFAGSGDFAFDFSDGLRLTLRHNPICRAIQSDHPVCDYYAATFQRIFEVIIHPGVQVTEIMCEAAGAEACVFRVEWP
jgi:divinyl protochlorophyllide a 8-vinyl-reductase